MRGVSVKTGFIGRDDLKKFVQFGFARNVKAKKVVIFSIAFEIQLLDAAGKTVFNKVFAVLRYEDAALLINEVSELYEFFIADPQILAKR